MKNILILLSILISTMTVAQTNPCWDEVTYELLDTIPPYFDILPAQELVLYDCVEPVIEELTGSDPGNGPVVITYYITPSLFCGCPVMENGQGVSYNILYTAMDQCGNSTTATTHVSVKDEEDPVIYGNAEDQVTTCDSAASAILYNNWIADNGGYYAADNCSGIFYYHNVLDSTYVCPGVYDKTVEFIAMDDCGNTTPDTALFYVNQSIFLNVDEYKQNELTIYPNPTDGPFELSMDVPFKVYDMSGKEVEGDQLSPGIYSIETEFKTLRLIVTE